MEGGTIMLLNLVDPTSAPGMQTTEKSEDVAQRIAPLVTETNRVLWSTVVLITVTIPAADSHGVRFWAWAAQERQ